VDKEDRRFVIEGSIKALVSFIPGIGGAIGSILSDALADRKEQRLNEFLAGLKTEIDANKDSLNKEFVSKVDFLDIFEKAFLRVAEERAEVKRLAFRNILLTGILGSNGDYNELERQIRILDLLDEEHISLLKFFSSPGTFSIESSTANANTMLRYFTSVFPFWSKDKLIDLLNDLETNRLIENYSGNLQTMMSGVSFANFTNGLTLKGKRFVDYILR
jgi:predicted S18 family serine protease